MKTDYHHRVTPERITALKDGEVFVFGSNLNGWHGGGAARAARRHPEQTFLVTPIGCGIAGFSPREIAPLFREAVDVENIHLPNDFWEQLKRKQQDFNSAINT